MKSRDLLLRRHSADSGGRLSAVAEAKTTLNALFMAQAGYSETDVRAMTDAYLKNHPDVSIKLEFVPYEQLHDKITLASGFGAGLRHRALRRDLAGGVRREQHPGRRHGEDRSGDQECGRGRSWTTVYYKDKAFGMPWSVDSKYLFYNKEMLQKAGIANPPKTWDELLADAKIIKQKGIVEYPIVWSWQQAEAVICDYASCCRPMAASSWMRTASPLSTRAAASMP